jgi:Rrf2 family protein
MLSLSVTTGYAIKALSCLEGGDCSPRHISDIARCTNVPRAYLAKILNALSQHGLVQTKRGYRGGISLRRRAEDISLLQIVEAVEGGQWLGDCLLGMEECSARTICPTRNLWARIRGEITEELRKTTLAALIASQRRGGLQANGVTKRIASSACACSQDVPA